MSNPIARRLGITKNWSGYSIEYKLIKGFLKALNIHSSDIYILSHFNKIYLYLHISKKYFFLNKRNKFLYRSFIRVAKNKNINRLKWLSYLNKNNNKILYYSYKKSPIYKNRMLYYLKLLKLL